MKWMSVGLALGAITLSTIGLLPGSAQAAAPDGTIYLSASLGSDFDCGFDTLDTVNKGIRANTRKPVSATLKGTTVIAASGDTTDKVRGSVQMKTSGALTKKKGSMTSAKMSVGGSASYTATKGSATLCDDAILSQATMTQFQVTLKKAGTLTARFGGNVSGSAQCYALVQGPRAWGAIVADGLLLKPTTTGTIKAPKGTYTVGVQCQLRAGPDAAKKSTVDVDLSVAYTK